MAFYGYIHCKPDGTPFYVGKGDETRVSSKKRHHNKHHMNILKKYGEENILVGKMECSTEELAFDLERGLIKRLRKMGANIVNLTDGGDGAKGAIRSPETRAKMSQAQAGNKKSLGRVRSAETRAKISAGKLGNNWNVGRKYSDETRRKRSRSLGGTPVECVSGNVVLIFQTISEAARSLNLDPANVVNHLKRKSVRKSRGIKGWFIRRLPE